MSQPRIDAVLFDMDGTLFNTEIIHMQGWIQAAKAFSQSFTETDYKAFVGVVTDECHQIIHQKWGADFPIQDFINHKSKLQKTIKAEGVTLMQGAQSFFDECASRCGNIGIVTSSSLDDVHTNFNYFTGFEKLKSIVASEDVVNRKPAPDCYLLACEQLGVKPEHTLVFEDSNPGCLASINAGCKTVMIPDMKPVEPEIEPRLFAMYPDLVAAQPLINLLK